MKTIVNTFLCFLLMGSSAFAVPYLQLDAEYGKYNTSTETIVSNISEFTLYALVNKDIETLKKDGEQFYISIALTPKVTKDANFDFGSFSFNGIEYLAKDENMKYGTPPVDATIKDLQTHGIYDTYYIEHSFSFNNTNTFKSIGKTNLYNVQDSPGGPTKTDQQESLAYAAFDVDVSKLNPNYQLHFDMYTVADGKITNFAPFSHDVESGGRILPPPPGSPVPEPASILLFGFGLIGLARLCRKKLL